MEKGKSRNSEDEEVPVTAGDAISPGRPSPQLIYQILEPLWPGGLMALKLAPGFLKNGCFAYRMLLGGKILWLGTERF